MPASRHERLPWKNGLGVSRIIAGHPPQAGYDVLDWQVGSTEIGADCPFSSLPGLDRHFLVIDGAGVELECDGSRNRVDPGSGVFAFSGDSRTTCRLLSGTVRVFNAIARRGRFSAEVTLQGDGPCSLAADGSEIVIAVDLTSLDAWMLQDRDKAELRGRLAVARIRRADQ